MASKQEYAIAGSYREFMEWRRDDLAARRYVVFLNTPERAKGREKGVVHRIGTWQVSPAREAAERLESLAKAVVGS